MKTQITTPFEATHPGTLIKDELEVRGDITQKDLAREMAVKPSFLNEIIKGKRPLTADHAIILEKILGISATYWMKFQSQYDIDKARVKERNTERLKNIEIWDNIKKYVPIKDFKKRGYLSDSIPEDVNKIKQIYNVPTIDDLVKTVVSSDNDMLSFYRKSKNLKIDNKNVLAWRSITNYEAQQQQTNRFYTSNLEQLYIELNRVFLENRKTVEKTKAVLNQFGIKFVITQKFDKAPIDGYSFWSGDNPAIGLTLRHSRIDNFAFTIMHELGHIVIHLLHDKSKRYIDLDVKFKNESICEHEADRFAQEHLIPDEVWSEIVEKNLCLDDEEIMASSLKFGINPAIILGRICYENNDYRIKTDIDRHLN